MAYLDYLSQDLEQWNSSTANAELRRRNRAEPTPVVRALQAVLVEIEQAQMFVAVSASIATAMLGKDRAGIGPWHLRTYGPAEPEIYSAIGGTLNTGLDIEQLLPILSYYGRLGFAQRLSQSLLQLGPQFADNQNRRDIEKLEDAWRHVCSASLEASQSIRNWLDLESQSCPPVINDKAGIFLKSAERGERPCVGLDGQVGVPGWAESRAAKRVPVRRTAAVQYRGGRQSVMIDNASATGLGLSGLTGGLTGRMIVLNLDGGETLTGRIAWDHDRRTGVQLDDRLPADHVLLAGLPS